MQVIELYSALNERNIKELSPVDIGYYMIYSNQKPMYWKDLVTDIARIYYNIDSKITEDNRLRPQSLSEIYTLINIDSRFAHQSKGMWTLKEWLPAEKKKGKKKKSEDSKKKRSKKKIEEYDEDFDMNLDMDIEDNEEDY